MRIIGQLMTWLIGERLALEGAKVPSSNTDGIYVFDIEEELNKKLVDAELEKLYVKIDPEPVYLVSKDANNRMELEIEEDGSYKVVSAKGGTLTSWGGATVDKRLSHPALIDKVLTIYLQNDHIADKTIDKDLIHKAINDYIEELKVEESKGKIDSYKRQFVLMSSWVMRSTSGSIFIDENDNVYPGTIRSWLSNDGVHLDKYGTTKRKISGSIIEFTKKLFPTSVLGAPHVIEYLTELNLLDKYFSRAAKVMEVPEYQKIGESIPLAVKMKVSNLSDTAKLHIDNHSILEMSDEEIDNIYQNLNIDEYVDMVASFAKVWYNDLKKS